MVRERRPERQYFLDCIPSDRLWRSRKTVTLDRRIYSRGRLRSDPLECQDAFSVVQRPVPPVTNFGQATENLRLTGLD